MSGTKHMEEPDDEWGIKVQRHKGDLKHDTNSADCWCCPTKCQPCRKCGVCWWEDGHVDEVAENPDKLPLMEKFRAQADDDCPVCHGRGLEAAYDDEMGHLIFHR